MTGSIVKEVLAVQAIHWLSMLTVYFIHPVLGAAWFERGLNHA